MQNELNQTELNQNALNIECFFLSGQLRNICGDDNDNVRVSIKVLFPAGKPPDFEIFASCNKSIKPPVTGCPTPCSPVSSPPVS